MSRYQARGSGIVENKRGSNDDMRGYSTRKGLSMATPLTNSVPLISFLSRLSVACSFFVLCGCSVGYIVVVFGADLRFLTPIRSI